MQKYYYGAVITRVSDDFGRAKSAINLYAHNFVFAINFGVLGAHILYYYLTLLLSDILWPSERN